MTHKLRIFFLRMHLYYLSQPPCLTWELRSQHRCAKPAANIWYSLPHSPSRSINKSIPSYYYYTKWLTWKKILTSHQRNISLVNFKVLVPNEACFYQEHWLLPENWLNGSWDTFWASGGFSCSWTNRYIKDYCSGRVNWFWWQRETEILL